MNLHKVTSVTGDF